MTARLHHPQDMAPEGHVRPDETTCANAIFQQPWWLDALAPGRWDESTVERGGRIVARLPFVVRGRGRLRVLTMPPLTQTLGPWVESTAAKPAEALSEEHSLLQALEAGLPAAEVFDQHFSPAMLNALPFYWQGYRLEVAYTYRLTGLDSEEALWDALRSTARTQIRKARTRVQVRDDLGLDQLYAVWAKMFERLGRRPPVSLDVLDRLDTACAARDARAMLFAQDDAGRVHAVAYTVWDEHAAYYLLGGVDPAFRSSAAGSLLIWESIMRARAATDVFDFEGSMIEPVERFFRTFGAQQTPYLRVVRARLRARAALSARAGAMRLATRVRAYRHGQET
jgi:CelD/BcsL family acetyltransferase involved in cellulose biosynthesis